MALEHHPIQNSEVYLLTGHSQPHPPPPSPPTPCETRAMSPIPDDFMPITPTYSHGDRPEFEKRLSTAVHVLDTEATALSSLTRLYQVDTVARDGFYHSVDAITKCMERKGKIVICGVGKSGHIAKKLVATMISLGVKATFLHPTEALHGDLGKVSDADVILFITFSGRTQELLLLLPHLNPLLPVLIITSHTHRSTCAIIDARPDAILLPAPIHESETDSFGVSAPTTSTTIALALGDALAVAVSEELHPSVAKVFLKNHPGGAIGQGEVAKGPQNISDIAIPISDIPFVGEGWGSSPNGVHVILSGYKSPSGWVRYSDDSVVPPRRIRRLQPDDMNIIATKIHGLGISSRDHGLVVSRRDWIPLPGDMTIEDAISWVILSRQTVRGGDQIYHDDAVIATIHNGGLAGVFEIATLFEQAKK